MYLNRMLIIKKEDEIIRNIKFNMGLNLIVDDTPAEVLTDSGNGVGKTTVLKLIDYCLGGQKRHIYTGSEGKSSENTEVKNFLIDNEVLVVLELSNNKELTSTDLKIERNFLTGKKKIQKINGKDFSNNTEFESVLKKNIFNTEEDKPTLRQLLKHSIRYDDYAIERLIRHIHPTTKNIEYEALYLFMLGLPIQDAEEYLKLDQKLKKEQTFLKNLEKEQTSSGYIAILNGVIKEIDELEKIKKKSIINKKFEEDFSLLNEINIEIGTITSEISNLKLSKRLIENSIEKIESENKLFEIDEISRVYEEYESLFKNKINKKFEELVEFHEKMISNKSAFISKELPSIEQEINQSKDRLAILLSDKKEIDKRINESISILEYEELLNKINNKYEEKGRIEKQISLIKEVENKINDINSDILLFEEGTYSEEFQAELQNKINSFNENFSEISYKLYGEKFYLKVDILTDKKTNNKYYDFKTFNPAEGSGKKQGEILAFEIAYIMYALDNDISSLKFILNDKKELMHDNQLIKLIEILSDLNVQVVFSMLYDKLPEELKDDDYILLRLDPNEKLFKF